MKLTAEEDFINNGFFHVTPELEVQISRFGSNKNKLMSIRFSWLAWSIWLEFNK